MHVSSHSYETSESSHRPRWVSRRLEHVLPLLAMVFLCSAAPVWGDGQPQGVSLFADKDFGGPSEHFPASDPDLRDNEIGQDSASSIRVAAGCQVRLYEDIEYGGEMLLLENHVENLRGLPVGNDAVSSLKVMCGLAFRPGVILYEHGNFEGRWEKFHGDDPSLEDNLIGKRSASSLQVDAGCEARVFRRANYVGVTERFVEEVANLRASDVGNDAISSLQVRCASAASQDKPSVVEVSQVEQPTLTGAATPNPTTPNPSTTKPTTIGPLPAELSAQKSVDERRGLERGKPIQTEPPTPEEKPSRLWTAEQREEVPRHVRFAHQPTNPTAELLASAASLFGPESPYTVLLRTQHFLTHDLGKGKALLAPVLEALRAITEDNQETFDRAQAQPGARNPNEDFRNLRNLLGMDLIVDLHRVGDLESAVEVALLLIADDPLQAGLGHEDFKLLHLLWSQAESSTSAAQQLDKHLAVVEKKWRLGREGVDLTVSLETLRLSSSLHHPVSRFLRRAMEGTRDSGSWVRGKRRGDAQEALPFALAGLLMAQDPQESAKNLAALSRQTAQTLDYLGHPEIAERLLQEVGQRDEVRSDEGLETLHNLHYAAFLTRNRRYEDAEKLYLEAKEWFKKAMIEPSDEAKGKRYLAQVDKSLGVLYDSMGRVAEADTRFAAAAPPPKKPSRPVRRSAEEVRQQTIEDGLRMQQQFRQPGNGATTAVPQNSTPSLLQRFGRWHSFEVSHASLAAFYSQRDELELAHRHGVLAVERDQFNWHWEPLLGIYLTLLDRQDDAGLERYRELLDSTYERVRAEATDTGALGRALARVYSEFRDYSRATELTPEHTSLDVLVGAKRIEEAYERSLAANKRGLESRIRFPNATGDMSAAQPYVYTLLSDYPTRLSPNEAFLLHLGFRQTAENRSKRARHRLLQLSTNRDLQTILRDYAYRQGAWARLFLHNLEPEPGGGFKATEVSASDVHMSREPGTIEKLFECAFYKIRPCTLHYQDAGAIHLSDFIHGRVLDVYGSNDRWLNHDSDMLVRKEADPAYWNEFVEFLALDRKQQIARSEALAAEFETIHDRYEAWQALDLDFSTLDAHLPQDSIYLDFGRFQRYDFPAHQVSNQWHYFVFAYRPGRGGVQGSLQFADLGPIDRIDRLLHRLRSTINRGRKQDLRAIRAQAADLHHRLLGPVAPLLDASKTVVVAAEGPLHLLPFEVLTRPDGEYLADTHTVVYSHASDWLDAAFWRTLPTVKSPESGVIFAAPDYSDQATLASGTEGKNSEQAHFWPPVFSVLEFAEKEGQTIEQLARRQDAVLVTGAEATELHLRTLTSPDFLHFATHGFFFAGAELPSQGVASRERRLTYLSGLAMAGANRLAGDAEARPTTRPPTLQRVVAPPLHDDGILTAAEVESLLLAGTRLVVLSACETAVGDTFQEIDKIRGQKIGEGVASLRRAFRTAGAENVIMSFWDLDDEVTRLFMGELYRHVFKGAPPSRALAAARRAVRQKLIERDGIDHPFYWAGLGLDTATLEDLER